MKKILIIFAIFILITDIYAQHIPPCQGTGHSDLPICYGYAMGRAFGKNWGSSDCPCSTLVCTGLGTYFDFTEYDVSFYDSVMVGDIIQFDGHVAYVTTKTASDSDHIFIDQVEGTGSTSETTYKTVHEIIDGIPEENIDGRGSPTSYWRKKPKWRIRVQTTFEGGQHGGQVKVDGSIQNSPHDCEIQWNESTSISTEEDGEENYSYH